MRLLLVPVFLEMFSIMLLYHFLFDYIFADKMETHKIISGSLGINVSGTPVILQTSLNNIG